MEVQKETQKRKYDKKKVIQAGATVRVVLFTSKTLANGEHPLMLCITQNRKRKYMALQISCSPDLWNDDRNEPKKTHPDKRRIESIIAKKIAEYKTTIVEFQDDKKDFTSETLVSAVEQPIKKTSLHEYFKTTIERLESTDRIKYAMSFKDTLRVIKQMVKHDIPLSDVTVKFCNDLETFLRKKKMKETTIAVYFRTLRVVINNAISEKLLRKQAYPFDDFKVSKFDLRTRKRAITKDQKDKIEQLDIDINSQLYKSRQFFLFSYYVRGINFIDIANLQWLNIEGERLYYVRSKTGDVFNIKLLKQAWDVINHWKPQTYIGDKTDYIFPILNREDHITATQIQNRTDKVQGQTNKDLKELGHLIGLDVPLTMYVARHTYATTLKRQGVAVSKISEAMGHESEAVTKTYLKSFEDDVLDESDKLL